MNAPSKALAGMVGACAFSLALAGCAGDSTDSTSDGGDSYKIGISQIVSHPSLDLIADGFKDALKEADLSVRYDEQNAQGDATNAATIAGTFASDSSIDLILTIATPTSQAMVSAVHDRPILFAGVTDPVEAELVKSLDGSGTNVSGTSDLNPEARPLELIQSLVPDAKTVGVLYSSSETNSEVQVATLEEQAKPLGLTIKKVAITNSSEIATGVQTLSDVDAIYVPTDNTVVSGLEAVADFADRSQIPLFSADPETVARGAIATRGIDYYELGKRTGDMAKRILVDGEDPGAIPTLIVTDTELVINPAAAEKQGVTIPDDMLAGATIVGT